MKLLDYLIEKYGYNEVIFLNEIKYKEYSNSWLKKEIAKLTKEDKIIRFDKGIYYIPTDTILGKSKLDPRKVISKKYITYNDNTIGYYSGITFMNMLGISTQMPNTIEIYTNNEKSTARDVLIGKINVTVRKSRTEINKQNVAIMSFLELMNNTDARFYDVERKTKLINYIKENKITKDMISKYAPYFPDNALRTLVESEAIYYVA